MAKLSTLGADEVQWDTAHAFEIPGQFRCVHAPRSTDETDPPGVTVLYDMDGSHVHTVEIVLSQPSEGVHRLQAWNNGKFIAEGTSDENAPPTRFSWPVLNDCLSSQGISWALISNISILCAAACVGTAGAACVACIGGLASANGTVIGHCVGMAIAA